MSAAPPHQLNPLHVFTDGFGELHVDTSIEAMVQRWARTAGENPARFSARCAVEWHQLRNEELLTLVRNGRAVTATCAEWAVMNGVGELVFAKGDGHDHV